MFVLNLYLQELQQKLELRKKDMDKKTDSSSSPASKGTLEKMSSFGSDPPSRQSSNPHTPRNIRYASYTVYNNVGSQIRLMYSSKPRRF